MIPANDVNGTSFHGIEISVTPNQLIAALGEPHEENIDGKVCMEWAFQLEDGTLFTIYDWKEGYLNHEMRYEFHIGGYNKIDCIKGKNALRNLL